MIAPVFVEKLPGSLFTAEFLDYVAALAERPGVWAVWPGDEVDGVVLAHPGDACLVGLYGEGPGGATVWTRRAGRLYVQWLP